MNQHRMKRFPSFTEHKNGSASVGGSSLTLNYGLVQGSYWMTFCVAVSFASVYLQSLSYRNAELGIVLACGNLLSVLLGPELSAWIDRSERVTASKLVLPLLAVQAGTLCLLLFHQQKDLVTSIAYILFVGVSQSVNSINLKLYTDAVHAGQTLDYGTARGMGSASYVLLSMLLGFLVEAHTTRVLPLTGLVLCLYQAVSFVLLQRKRLSAGAAMGNDAVTAVDRDPGAPAKADVEHASSLGEFLIQNRSFTIMLLGTALIFFSHNISGTYMINVVRNVGGDTSSMGVINAYVAAVEIPVMLLCGKLLKKQTPAALLRIAFACFLVKAAAIAMAPSIPTLVAALAFQAPSFALYTAVIVPYVERTLPYRDSAKAQSLAFTVTTLGSVLASLFGGMLYDTVGVTATLWVAMVICCLGTAITLSSLKPRRKQKSPRQFSRA